ncbi:MAG: TIGR00269 family protein [Candidatus Micrarchaeota archaeon]|nr:TIGR00269 family protein [Candidatus Micrarchaeota archaeon]
MAICSFCNRNAILYQPYSCKLFCGKHLSDLTEKRVGSTMRKYGMVRNRSRIGVAVSGGKDSTTMLYIMHRLLRKDRSRTLIAITVDEGLRGYRDKSIRCARALCSKLGVEHHIYRFSEYAVKMDTLMRHPKPDPCTYCGVFRRWVLNLAAREHGLDAIAIGHNLDDVVQTFQMNIMRNEPLRIARYTPNGGIATCDEFVPRIRPLLTVPEREVMAYALHNGIPFHNGECPYAGLALRNPVREFINSMEAKYPGTKFRMLNTYLSLIDRLPAGAAQPIRKCKLCSEPSSSETCKRCELLSYAKCKGAKWSVAKKNA